MSATQPVILVVEDEQRIAQILVDYLRQASYAPIHAGTGTQALALARSAKPDLILLDIMLPEMDGLTVCREIHKSSAIPIIMVSARVEELDRLLGLELGADDYICKPFSPREVVARVKAVLRRAQQAVGGTEDKFSLEIDAEGCRASIGGCELDLTRTEFKLLELLASRPGRVYSRAQILELAYDDEQDVSDRVVDSHVKNLRRKIAELAGDREVIRSVYGVGYRYEV